MMNDEQFKRVVQDEITQREEEGCDVSEITLAFNQTAVISEKEFESMMKRLSELQPQSTFPYHEPSAYNELRAVRPDGPRRLDLTLSEDHLRDKIYGGWLGRCAGCLLGKPVEGLEKARIEQWLQIAGAYPLQTYFPPLHAPELPEWLQTRSSRLNLLQGHITHMVRDDDMDYPILNLHLLSTSGFTFTTTDVGNVWLNTLPYLKVYTAERVTYRNLVNSLRPPHTATYMNPYREWIGAQIRADMWGYVTPGRPEYGAELAYRDATLSHVKNGIYGEMFVSAMISAAFVTDVIDDIISIGLAAIPKRSRLTEAVNDVVTWSKKYGNWRDSWDQINAKYGHYHRVHTINNAALVVLGLLYGNGDYEKSITISVMGGWDTDCNGATTGSILGVMLGAKNLPDKWITPLNDRIESFIIGYNNSQISDLANETFQLATQLQESDRPVD